MCKKLFVLVLVLGLASVVSAVDWRLANVELKDGAVHDVSTTESITGNLKISCRPTALSTTLNVNTGADVSIGTYVRVGHYSTYHTTGVYGTLNIAGGKLTSAGFMVGTYHGKGVLNVSSGTLESTAYMALGGSNNSGSIGDGVSIAEVDISGGLVKAAEMMIGNGVTYPYNDTDMTLSGGVLECGTLAIGTGGTDVTLDICGGTIVVTGQGEEITDLDALAGENSTILAYGGSGSLVYDYDDMEDINTIYAIPEPATIALLGLGGLALIRRKR